MTIDNLTSEKLQIQEQLHRAAYALDECEVEMLAAAFAESAEFSMRIAGGDLIGPFVGRTEIMKLMTDSMEQQTDQRRHVISNLFFELLESDTAQVVSNLSLFATENGEITVLTAGVYRDRLVKCNGQWCLQRRHLDLDRPY